MRSNGVEKRALDMAAVLLIGLLAWVGVAQASADERFQLPKAIPSDVFVLEAGHYNPERDFEREHWSRVWTEWEKSGIGTDLMTWAKDMMDPADRAEFERIYDRFGKICSRIDWDALGKGEFCYAQRMTAFEVTGDNVTIGLPDMIFLFRQESGDAPSNYQGLVAMLQTIIDEINGASGMQMKLDTQTRGEAQFTVFDLGTNIPDGPDFAISIGNYKNIVMVSLGEELRNAVADRLTGKSEGESIIDTPRFKAAFKHLPQPEDGLVYFDMPNMRGQITQIVDAVFAAIAADGQAQGDDRVADPELFNLIGDSIEAYEAKDYKKALEITKKAHDVDPQHPIVLYNLACFNALTGETETAMTWLEKAAEAGFSDIQLMKTDSDLETLRKDPRYAAAVETAEKKLKMGGLSREARNAQSVVYRILSALDVMDSAATVYHTEGYAVHSNSVTLLAKHAKDNPLYPVINGHERIKDWSKYLPVETTDFSVSAGVSLPALYTYMKDTVLAAGDDGKQMWGMWEGFQEEMGFSVQRDVLDWLDLASVSVNFQLDGTDVWAVLLKVRNEKVASEKLAMGLNMAGELLQEASQEIPPLAMLSLEVEESSEMEGFHELFMPVLPEPMMCGVRDGWIMIAANEDALYTILNTAAGDHPNVSQNAFISKRGLQPKGEVEMMTFTDHRGDAEALGQMLGGITSMAGMITSQIPDPEAQQMVGPIFTMLSRLGPVVSSMNFYEASASTTEYADGIYRTRGVTHYVPIAQ